jgi:hypothetical protein
MKYKPAAHRVAIGAALLAVLAAQGAAAQETAGPPDAAASGEASGVIPYPATFFAGFKPPSAFEMVQRLPGFSLSLGADVRGFGGAAGNVLIDGERPSSKSVGLDVVLQRIPASQVERIDIIRGGAPGIDMQGQSVVANVIRSKTASASVTVQGLAKIFRSGFVGWVPRVEGSLRSGPLSIDGLISYRNDLTNGTGDGPFTRYNAAGVQTQSGQFTVDEKNELSNISASGEYRGEIDTFRANFAGEREMVHRNEISPLVDRAGAFQTHTYGDRVSQEWEVGGDYEHPFSSTLTARLIGVATLTTHKTNGFNRSTRGQSQTSSLSSESGERIARGLLISTPVEGLRIEGGAETAFNYLDSESTLTVSGAAVVLPSANIRVEERRAEAFTTASWRASPTLTLEGGLRYERSTISQTGGANLEKTLSFAKPRVIVSWAPDPASQVRLRVSREVGQLTFTDFAAAAELDTGAHNAGNANLEPDRSWLVEAAYERRFWGNGAAVITVSRARIESVVDQIPINNRFDAPGNIGDGWRQTVKLTLALPFDRIGLRGGMLKLNGTWLRSEVTDPTTGRARPISDEVPFAGDFTFTKTFPNLNSVLTLETLRLANKRTVYRISEIRSVVDGAYARIFWDWNPSPDLNLRLWVENIFDQSSVRKRLLYSGPRSADRLDVFERREKKNESWLVLRVRKTF